MYNKQKCCINSYWHMPVSYDRKLHTYHHLIAAQQEPYKKAELLTKNV